jgi:hypothetical protein
MDLWHLSQIKVILGPWLIGAVCYSYESCFRRMQRIGRRVLGCGFCNDMKKKSTHDISLASLSRIQWLYQGSFFGLFW